MIATPTEAPRVPPAPPARGGAARSMPLWIAVVGIVLAYIRFGYDFGIGDQDELIPSVMRLLDPTLFTRDWLIETVTSGLNVRSYYLWLVALPSFVMPVWLAAVVLWLAVGIAVAYGIFELAMELTHDRVAAAIGTILAMAVTVRFTIGANALLYHMLVPEGVAWAVALPGMVLFLRGRMIAAGAVLGVAAWFHLLAGMHPALLLGLFALAGVARRERDFKQVLLFGGSFIAAALPILVPVAWEQLVAATPDPEGPSPFYIHAYFRNPFHHLLSAVEPGQLLRFGLVFGAGIMSALWLKRRKDLRHAPMLGWCAAMAVVLIIGGAVLVEGVGSGLVMKLQFQKLTVLLVLFSSLLIGGAVSRMIGDRRGPQVEALMDRRAPLLALSVLIAAAVGFISIQDMAFGDRAHPVRHQETELATAERWVRDNTPTDALFAIPPSISTFRTNARRSIVANYAGFVFTDADMQRWYERLLAVAPIDPPEVAFGVKDDLDAAYHRNDLSDWQRLRQEFGIDFVLLDGLRTDSELPLVASFGRWQILAIAP